jgi:hypothetical protein
MRPSSYSSQTINVLKYWSYSSFIGLAIVVPLIWVNAQFDHKVGMAGIAVLVAVAFALPFLFEAKLKPHFIRRAVIQCDSDSLSIIEWSSKTHAKLTEFVTAWDQIAAYKFYFSIFTSPQHRPKTFFTVYLRGGGKKTYCFEDKPTKEEAMSEHSVFGILRAYIRQYNAGRPVDAQIVLKPPFFATHLWTMLLGSATLLAVYNLVFQYRTHSELLTLAVIILMWSLGLWGNKFASQALYRKLNKA